MPVRPDIAGIMGAFGAALIARERYDGISESTMLSIDKINSLTYETKLTHCQGCTNHCYLTINKFSGEPPVSLPVTAVSVVLAKRKSTEKLPNLFDYKLKRLFGYEPLSEE